jgi:hypothetical protein
MEDFIAILRQNYYKNPFQLSDQNLLSKLLLETQDHFNLILETPKKNIQNTEQLILKEYTVVISYRRDIEKVYKSTENVKFLALSILKNTNKAQFQLLAKNRRDIIEYIHSIIECISLITII